MSQPPDPVVLPDLTDAREHLLAGTYTGRDPANLVTAVVDGHGIVAQIRFATMVGTRPPEVVEEAVLTAVAAAQAQLDEAWRGLAARMDPAEPTVTPSVTPSVERVDDGGGDWYGRP